MSEALYEAYVARIDRRLEWVDDETLDTWVRREFPEAPTKASGDWSRFVPWRWLPITGITCKRALLTSARLSGASRC
jgi:hypothetical protein